MLRIENIDAGYGDINIISNISLEVREGEIVSLVGGNGAGKTTFIGAMTGLIKPTKGTVSFKGEEITKKRSDEIVQRGLIQVPEERQLFGKLTVSENLEMGAIHKRPRENRDKTLKKVYNMFPILFERKNQKAGTLSGGEQQMCAIARGLMGLPRLLVLDEPSLGLAPIIIKQIFDIIAEINKDEKITIFLVEQNLNASLKMSDRGYVLENGRIVLDGSGQELLENEHTKKAYLGL